ncbi:DUF4394 domain-containing protein [Pseudazoarcus pumilus]|uniref:DUF4394 domain-containing protein n=1 Tax=Pseudazoarcus pumilus TaxID=2067960 RepID=A0A2I6S314_9RHOO|nr:DUF4394 domain-containing protein [Pseudazoarcus pumilus]AUN93607.1 hypothetical protein C0099_00845 [Pseudazoarcus pumilus]
MNKQILTALCLGTALLALPGTGAVAQTPALMALSKAPSSVYALTAKHELIRFDPAEPDKVLERVQVTGLADGDTLRGIDYRVAHGVMYALGARGQLYTVDPKSGALSRVGDGKLPLDLPEGPLGFDFNPAADRVRVVAETGLNLRLHPETGEAVDFDPDREGFQADRSLRYAFNDRFIGQEPSVSAAAYTYNPDDEKLTTNFAIDRERGTLAIQGTREGTEPPVSPNLGVLNTIGDLGTGALDEASFDISDINNTALAALRVEGGDKTELYRVNLDLGRAMLIGTIGDGEPLLGLAIEP